MTQTIRSRSNREIGQLVEGKTILEKKIIIAPDPVNKRLGVYEYVVEVSRQEKKSPAVSTPDFTRGTPEERGAGLIRRLGSR
jgi:hypothetical protein